MQKIIIDTNWWIAFMISKKSNGLPPFFFGDIFFCFSEELSMEIKSTLQYPHIAKRINQKNLAAYNFFEQTIAKFFTVKEKVTICRDAKDNFLLALAKAAGADFLITRDDDLLVLKQFEKTSIVTLPQFLEIFSNNL